MILQFSISIRKILAIMASNKNLFKQGILLDTKIIDRIEKVKIGMQRIYYHSN
jgi:hypothetical protein